MQETDKLQVQALIQLPVGEEKTSQKSIQASSWVYSTTDYHRLLFCTLKQKQMRRRFRRFLPKGHKTTNER